MSLKSPKLLKTEKKLKKKIYQPSRNPETCNPTYLRPLKVGCRYCNNSGRPKNFGSLNRLYFHFRYHHPSEPRHKELVKDLADKLLEGTLL